MDTPDNATPRITRLVYDNPRLRITRTEHPHGLILQGEIDVSVHEPFVDALADALDDTGDAPMRVDCAGVEFIDLGAFRLMVGALAERGLWGPILLDYLPDQARTILDATGLAQTRLMPGRPRAG